MYWFQFKSVYIYMYFSKYMKSALFFFYRNMLLIIVLKCYYQWIINEYWKIKRETKVLMIIMIIIGIFWKYSNNNNKNININIR